MEFTEQVGAYIGGNTPLIQIVSHEWEVVEGEIHGGIENAKEKREYLKWSESLGMQLYENGVPKNPLPEHLEADSANFHTPQSVLRWYIGENQSESGKRGYEKSSVLHLEDFHMFLDPNYVDYNTIVSWLRQAARMHQSRYNKSKRTIILGATSATYIQELDKEMPVIHTAPPGAKELEIVLDSCIKDAAKSDIIIEINDDERAELVTSTLGLTVMEAEIAYNKAIHLHKTLSIEHIPFILNEKKQIIKRTGILEFIEVEKQEVGGLVKLTDWLDTRKEGFSSKAKEYGLEYPRGILLLGFPGCGKSLTAIHTAKTWNYPLLRFDIGRAFGGLVGESERNMRQALEIAEAVSPCILWIDEIEKGLSGIESSGQTDGGTTARVLGTFLTWMQEKTAPVFVLATSNNIDRMPPELTRKGRFDEIFFVDLPNKKSRVEIFKIHIDGKPESSRGPLSEFNLEELSEKSKGFTGAEIKQSVVEAMHVSFSEGRKITQDDIIEALKSTYPMYIMMREVINNMRIRKGKMYKSADEGDSEPLPARRKDEDIPLTTTEFEYGNRFIDSKK